MTKAYPFLFVLSTIVAACGPSDPGYTGGVAGGEPDAGSDASGGGPTGSGGTGGMGPTCAPLTADCNHDPADGCETNTGTDPWHCGECNTFCSYANAAGACEQGVCHLGHCNPGWEDCTPDDGCETHVIDDPHNCGGCGNVCPEGTSCADGKCSPVDSCDDGNPCTVDVYSTSAQQCFHGPASGNTSCPGGVCLSGAGTCCFGCNMKVGTIYQCVAACPLGPCVGGYCATL